MNKGFRTDNKSRYRGYDLICNNCNFRVTYDMKHALDKKECPKCGNGSYIGITICRKCSCVLTTESQIKNGICNCCVMEEY